MAKISSITSGALLLVWCTVCCIRSFLAQELAYYDDFPWNVKVIFSRNENDTKVGVLLAGGEWILTSAFGLTYGEVELRLGDFPGPTYQEMISSEIFICCGNMTMPEAYRGDLALIKLPDKIDDVEGLQLPTNIGCVSGELQNITFLNIFNPRRQYPHYTFWMEAPFNCSKDETQEFWPSDYELYDTAEDTMNSSLYYCEVFEQSLTVRRDNSVYITGIGSASKQLCSHIYEKKLTKVSRYLAWIQQTMSGIFL